MQLWILFLIFCQVFPGYHCPYVDIIYRNCPKPIAFDCYDYCHNTCGQQNYKVCRYRCHEGCGCKVASIVRNNGGCLRLEVCGHFEDSAVFDPEVDANATTAHDESTTTLRDPDGEDQATEVTDDPHVGAVTVSESEDHTTPKTCESPKKEHESNEKKHSSKKKKVHHCSSD
ncbi:hypothetical protein KR074_006690 [Drosophila pseudoananassae]|nr:hypothetical protein KR074_006690 [Drosophila pseudoananassae]